VQRRLILDIRALADLNPLDVTAQDRSIKNTRIRADLDVADDRGTGRDPHSFV
jgi:hypothetical protein